MSLQIPADSTAKLGLWRALPQGYLTLLRPVIVAMALLAATLNATAQVSYAPTADDALPAAVLGEGQSPVGKPVAYFAEDPAAQGYLAEPVGEGPFGAVILIHEWNGLVERVKQVADAFAAEGYVALAADLYSGRTGTNREENMALVTETLADTDKLVRNLDAAASYLKARDDVAGAGGKVAAIGWCYGGGVALTYALGSDNHEGTAIFYGRLLDDPERMRHIHHEIYGTFAEMDGGIPPADVNAFVAAMRSAGIDNDVHIYDDVKHGFWLHVDRDPQTNAAPALDAWQRLKAYLGRINGGNSPREPLILTD